MYVSILLAIAVIGCVWRLAGAYRAHIIKITTSGYIPTPSPWMRAVTRLLFRFWCFVQIGKVTVVNAHYLETPERVIACANHSSLLDAQVLFTLAKRPFRIMGAYEVMRKAGGLVGLVMAGIGVFPVDRAHGGTVIEPAVDLVVAGEPLALAPEGKINPDGELGIFKHGAPIIAKAAYLRLGGKVRVGFLPVHIWYHKRHAASALSYARMGLRWRGGVTVTVCEPIWLNDLDDLDPEAMTLMIRDAIAAVQARWKESMS